MNFVLCVDLLRYCPDDGKQLLQMLVEKGSDLLAVNAEGNTPLMLAVKASPCLDMMAILVPQQSDGINAVNKDGMTALSLAISSRCHHRQCTEHTMDCLVKLLLDFGANPFAELAERKSILSYALQSGKASLTSVQMILEKGVQPNEQQIGLLLEKHNFVWLDLFLDFSLEVPLKLLYPNALLLLFRDISLCDETYLQLVYKLLTKMITGHKFDYNYVADQNGFCLLHLMIEGMANSSVKFYDFFDNCINYLLSFQDIDVNLSSQGLISTGIEKIPQFFEGTPLELTLVLGFYKISAKLVSRSHDLTDMDFKRLLKLKPWFSHLVVSLFYSPHAPFVPQVAAAFQQIHDRNADKVPSYITQEIHWLQNWFEASDVDKISLASLAAIDVRLFCRQ